MAELNVANRTLFHGDNLEFLRGINSGTVHLIATDPPFNKSKDFHATPDTLASGAQFHDRWSWKTDIHDDWLIEIQRDHPAVWQAIDAAKKIYGDDMGAFLCWLGVRLLEMHRILRDDGSIYLHCDPTASHYLKSLMDAIFGRKQFGTEIIWQRTSAHPSAGKWANTHDVILYYTKSSKYTWNRQFQDPNEHYVATHYIYKDANGKYRAADLTGAGTSAGPSGKPWRGFDPTAKGRHWGYTPDKLDAMDATGTIHWPTKQGGWPAHKVYLENARKRPVHSTWFDIPPINSQAKERTGYPTQKPLVLYERIIEASSNTREIVLDPFCGCATIPIAAEKLGRQWIGMDTWDGAAQMIRKRMRAAGFDLGISARLPSGRRITITKKLPARTDGGGEAVLYLRTPMGKAKRYPPPRSQHERLLLDVGPFCQGCGRDYNFDPRVLEVDHVSPKSDGGTDAYENLTLLCPPCNKEKRDKITLTGLQERNRKNGHLLPQNEGNLRRGRGAASSARRRRRR